MHAATDWSSNKKLPLYYLDADGSAVIEWFPWLSDIIKRLKRGDHLAIESTFESYLPTKHNEVIDLAEELGIVIEMVSPRATANYRKTHGLEKSDAGDAAIIYKLAFELPYETSKPRRWDIVQEPTLAQQLVATRKSGYENEAGVRASERLARFGIEESALPLVSAVVAEAVVVMGGNRKVFDKEMGTYGNGRPSQPRALFMRDSLAAAVNRLVSGPGWMQMKAKLGQYPAERKEAMKANRKMTRMIYARVKEGMAKRAMLTP